MKVLGIMVCETSGLLSFGEQGFYKKLCTVALKYGMVAFVFSPLAIDWNLRQVTGYAFHPKADRWIKQDFPLPKLIYDRCFFNNRRQFTKHHSAISKLRQSRDVQFLGNPLQGKWAVHKLLLNDPSIKSYLPFTTPYHRAQNLSSWFKDRNEAFLKPQSGSQGRGVLHIKRDGQHFVIKGRTRSNASIEVMLTQQENLVQWLEQFMQYRKYIIQDYLTLTTHSGDTFDIRSLMQKNRKGQWQHTGMALRRGAPGSITSNLHGGGTAEEVLPFLTETYGAESARTIQETIVSLSQAIPLRLEQHYGRLLELGIDFGVDRQGRVWVLEVNSKPGRAIFLYLRNIEQRRSSIRNPIHYARYLLDRQLGG